ncbi:MAG: hypothetical protein M1483_03075 [Actinobacteria bacterium]|nr:hypothetical protein [Actinomycetota bacterium]
MHLNLFLRRVGVVGASVIMVVGLAGGFLGALLTTSAPVASATSTIAPQDCSFSYGGVTAQSNAGTNSYVGVLPVKTNVTVSINCSNMSPGSSLAVAASTASSLAGVSVCGGSDSNGCTAGQTPSGNDFVDIAEGSADFSDAAFETCIFGPCGSSWSTSFSTGNPWAPGGSQAGMVNSAGDANASCPTSPAPTASPADLPSASIITNMGLWFCIAAVVDTNGDVWGAAFFEWPTGSGTTLPANPTVAVNGSSSASVTAGATVKLSDATGNTSYWWGDPLKAAPSSSATLDGISLPAVPVAVYECPSSSTNPDPTPSSSCTVVQSTSTFTGAPVNISAGSYSINTNTSSTTYGYPSGSATSGMECSGSSSGTCAMGPPPTPEKLSGSVTAPSTNGQYALEVYEGNPIYTAAAAANAAGKGAISGVPPGNCSTAQATAVGVANCLTAYATINVSGGSSTTTTTTTTPSSTTTTVPSGATGYTPVTPYRICDTRAATSSGTIKKNQCDTNGTTPIPAKSGIQVQVAGYNSPYLGSGESPVPTGASAVVLNVTAIGGSAPSYLSVCPGGETASACLASSNLNFVAGQSIPNLVQVGLSSTGSIEVYNFGGSVNVAVDVSGYVGSVSSKGQGSFNSLSSPYRVCDTRTANGTSIKTNQCDKTGASPIGPKSGIQVQVAGYNSPYLGSGESPVPTGASAVVLNVTAIGGSAPSYLSVCPGGETSSTCLASSNLNFVAGQSIPNSVVVGLSSTGSIEVYNFGGSVNVAVDVSGWFSGPGGTGSTFTSVSSPYRVCDTRTANGTSIKTNQCDTSGASPIGPKSAIQVQVAGYNSPYLGSGATSVPKGATAVVLNVTAIGSSASSYLSVCPGGEAASACLASSNLNFVAGQSIPNFVTVGLNSSGDIEVYNFAGQVNAAVDVVGYY